MLPCLPVFRRTPLASGASEFTFDPHTLMLYTPGRYYAMSPGKPDFLGEVADYHFGLTHETCHWLQFTGTTIGNLLSLVNYSQQRTVLERLVTMPERVAPLSFSGAEPAGLWSTSTERASNSSSPTCRTTRI